MSHTVFSRHINTVQYDILETLTTENVKGLVLSFTLTFALASVPHEFFSSMTNTVSHGVLGVGIGEGGHDGSP